MCCTQFLEEFSLYEEKPAPSIFKPKSVRVQARKSLAGKSRYHHRCCKLWMFRNELRNFAIVKRSDITKLATLRPSALCDKCTVRIVFDLYDERWLEPQKLESPSSSSDSRERSDENDLLVDLVLLFRARPIFLFVRLQRNVFQDAQGIEHS